MTPSRQSASQAPAPAFYLGLLLGALGWLGVVGLVPRAVRWAWRGWRP